MTDHTYRLEIDGCSIETDDREFVARFADYFVRRAESPADETHESEGERFRPRSEVPEGTYAIHTLPLDTLIEHERGHALAEDFPHHDVINYQLLQQLSDGAWLISVKGRIYEVAEDVLAAGIRDSLDMMGPDQGGDESEATTADGTRYKTLSADKSGDSVSRDSPSR